MASAMGLVDPIRGHPEGVVEDPRGRTRFLGFQSPFKGRTSEDLAFPGLKTDQKAVFLSRREAAALRSRRDSLITTIVQKCRIVGRSSAERTLSLIGA